MSRLSKRLLSRSVRLSIRRHRAAMRIGMRFHAGKCWRLLFLRTVFIGMTGSHGKTTGTRLLARILRSQAPTHFRQWHNKPYAVWTTVLHARPWRHRFVVQEVSGHVPGAVARCMAVLRPQIGVITAVSGDHRKAFAGSMEAIAAEKGTLVRLLPANGLAVLNADDPCVAAMARNAPCRVVTFGRAPDCDLKLVDSRFSWPGRLALAVEYKGQRLEVNTQLVGEHWSVSVLAALLTALELGVPAAECVEAIAAVRPAYNRMSVHPSPQGGWYVLDAFKSSFFGIESCLAFLANAEAPRRTVVVGTISDYPGASRPHYTKVAKMALAVAERVIFTGRNAGRVRRLAEGEFAGRLFIAERPADALRLLEDDAVPGELIYIKATRVDRLGPLLVPGNFRAGPQPGVRHVPLPTETEAEKN